MNHLLLVAALLPGLLLAVTDRALSESSVGLRSPSQEVRDKSAEAIRSTFVPTSKAKWEPTLSAIQRLISRDSVMSLLRDLGATQEIVVVSGRTSNESYRLDDEWAVHCHFTRNSAGDTLHAASLHASMQEIGVTPPADFTGVWTTYFVNGRKSHDIEYVAGNYSGLFTAYRPDGTKAYVQHYFSGTIDGDDVGYFPSGSIMYRGRYKNGVTIGTWVHYNEDGTVQSTQVHADP